MLAKRNRLVKDKDFNKVFRQGKAVFNQLVGVKALNNYLSYSRFAILLNNKVSKSAVVRNRYRRQIRVMLSSLIKQFRVNCDLIIIVLPKIINKKSAEISQSISENLKRLKIIA